MRTPLILTFLIFIEAFVFGQELGNFKNVNTLRIIKSRHLPDYRIRYLNEDYEFQFSKKVCIKVIDTLLKRLESEVEDIDTLFHTKEGRLKDVNNLKIVRCYFKDQDSLKLKNLFYDETVDNPLELADSLFDFIAPAMLDAGRFKFFLKGKQQSTLIKVEVISGNDYYSKCEIKYMSENGKEVWTSPWYYEMLSEPYDSFLKTKTIDEIEQMELPIPEK